MGWAKKAANGIVQSDEEKKLQQKRPIIFSMPFSRSGFVIKECVTTNLLGE
jgi:hypothetical protein